MSVLSDIDRRKQHKHQHDKIPILQTSPLRTKNLTRDSLQPCASRDKHPSWSPLSNRPLSLSIVGLGETAVKESKNRMRGAILNSHFDFPARRITLNLAPTDLPKEGGRYCLPIAIGILAASGQIPGRELQHYEFAGELVLSGQLRAAWGILPIALHTQNTQRLLAIPLNEAAETWALPCQAVVSLLE